MSTLSEQDVETIGNAITRQMADVKAVQFEIEDDGTTYVFVERTDGTTRFLLGPLKRNTNGRIALGRIALLPPEAN